MTLLKRIARFLTSIPWPLILAALGTPVLEAQIPAPQINLTGNLGCQGFPCVNSGTLIMPSDANYSLSAQETSAFYIKVTSSVSLTATRNLISPAGRFPFTIENATTGGQSIQIIGASGTGVTIANGTTVAVWNDGTNYVQIGSVGGGGCTLGTVICNAGSINQILAQALGTTLQVNNFNRIVYSNGYSTIEQAVTGCNAVFPCQIIVSSTLTQSTAGTYQLPAGVFLEVKAGGKLTRSGQTLDFSLTNGVVVAGAYDIGFGTGTVTNLNGDKAEWFGAKGDGVLSTGAGTDALAAINAAVTALRSGQTLLGPYVYKVSGTINITANMVGLAGTQYGYPSLQPNGPTVIMATSATATIVSVTGQMDKVNNLTLQRIVLPTSGAIGLSTSGAFGISLSYVQSEDSIKCFQFQGLNGSLSTTLDHLSAGQSFLTVSGYSGNIYGFYFDQTSAAENTVFLDYITYAFFAGGATSHGIYITGPFINDIDINNANFAGTSYALYVNYTGAGASDSDTDIHVNFPTFDSCSISCVYINNVLAGGPGAINITNGYFQSAVPGVKLIDIENSSGIAIVDSEILDFTASGSSTGIYANGSKSLVFAGNTMQGFGAGPGTALSFVGTTNSSVTGNTVQVISGSGASHIMSFTSTSTNNAITGNSAIGNGNTSAQYLFDGTSLANDFVGNACSQGSGWSTCLSGAVTGTAPSALAAGSTMGGVPIGTVSITQTVVNCSTSGTVTFSQPMAVASLKMVEVYAAACLGTASYTYPTAFTNTPQVLSQSLAAIATTVSTTAVTITGSTSTGFLKLDGY